MYFLLCLRKSMEVKTECALLCLEIFVPKKSMTENKHNPRGIFSDAFVRAASSSCSFKGREEMNWPAMCCLHFQAVPEQACLTLSPDAQTVFSYNTPLHSAEFCFRTARVCVCNVSTARRAVDCVSRFTRRGSLLAGQYNQQRACRLNNRPTIGQ